jgi:hypothetical protein
MDSQDDEEILEFTSEISTDRGPVIIKTEIDEHSITVLPIWNSQSVGKLRSIVHPDLIFLGDITVNDDVRISSGFFGSLFGRTRTVSLRRSGIGSAMMHQFLQAVLNQGVGEVFGYVTAGDLHRTPNLLRWYARFGFESRDARVPPEMIWMPPETICEVVWKSSSG